ncbi:hypothetical protein ACET3Z_029940 [Daucus carota]
MLKLYAGKDIRNPKNTHVFVNAWAIGRDEEIWEDALSFKPERFLESSIGSAALAVLQTLEEGQLSFGSKSVI